MVPHLDKPECMYPHHTMCAVCRSKGCECKKLDWQFGARGDKCIDCNHSPMMHSALFNQEILNPITKSVTSLRCDSYECTHVVSLKGVGILVLVHVQC